MTFEVAFAKKAAIPSDRRFVSKAEIRPDGLSFNYLPMIHILQRAYERSANEPILGPEWITSTSDLYTIVAKCGRQASRSELMQMLRVVLADRFKLKAHRALQERSVYSMVVSKGRLKIHSVVPDGSGPLFGRKGNGIYGTQVSMGDVANFLGRILDRPVIDRTGIKGVFSFSLDYANENFRAILDAEDSALSVHPTILSALTEQLGLQLESKRLLIDVLHIDHLERIPTDN